MTKTIVLAESLVLGAVLTSIVVVRPPSAFLAGRHARRNYRGATIAGTLGVLLVVPLVVGCAIAVAAHAGTRTVAAVALAGVMLGLIGLIDDVYGDRRAGGLVGHARALLHRRATTGTLKAFSGAAVGLAAAWLLGARGGWWVLGGAVIALSSNMANLLDVRPGRCVKVWLVAYLLLVGIAHLHAGVFATAGLAGGAAAFLHADLGERAMLGDGGAAVLGASLGTAAVASVGHLGLVAIAAVLAGLTAASEAVSFTQVIDRVAPLRFLDTLGRRA
jgi:UDP-N-acetylmuramyl pentapeptide phosphotransferase/UDP-N-acetylglucosamine-1-phosphate transferase